MESMQSRGRRGSASTPRRQVALALQGGGSHGAFTWGVLDRLLEEPGLDFVGVSGTSAGAMNAAVLAHGLRSGADAARDALRGFWEDLGGTPGLRSVQQIFWPWMPPSTAWHFDHSPLFHWLMLMARMFSPYQLNPLNLHPLRPLLERIDFEGLRNDPRAVRLFIGATNVHTGRRRVFDNAELSPDVLLASACLPLMFQAVEIDGSGYWDGGYTGNPVIVPLYQHTAATDLVIVGINPLLRERLPRSAREITDRIDEISFTSAFLLELSGIAFIDSLLDMHAIDARRFRPMLLHAIDGGARLASLGASSKLNNERAFLLHLHALGREAAEGWLAAHRDDVGARSTVNVEGLSPMGSDFHDGLIIRQSEPARAAGTTPPRQRTRRRPHAARRTGATG